ncbi:unnamed protein product [Merluccius merluccius]
MAAEGDMKPRDLHLQSSESLNASGKTDNGVAAADSPEETFSPTSVIFFKEALNSCNLRFGGSVSPTPVRQYEFHIERKRSKTYLSAILVNTHLVHSLRCNEQPNQSELAPGSQEEGRDFQHSALLHFKSPG